MPANGEIKPLSEIPIVYVEFNSRHHLIRRQDRETFVIKDPHSIPPNAEAVITAKTIQLFVLHCQRMQDPTKDTPYNPVAYRKVAEDKNDFDMSPIYIVGVLRRGGSVDLLEHRR
jgi:hypothetical protein